MRGREWDKEIACRVAFGQERMDANACAKCGDGTRKAQRGSAGSRVSSRAGARWRDTLRHSSSCHWQPFLSFPGTAHNAHSADVHMISFSLGHPCSPRSPHEQRIPLSNSSTRERERTEDFSSALSGMHIMCIVMAAQLTPSLTTRLSLSLSLLSY